MSSVHRALMVLAFLACMRLAHAADDPAAADEDVDVAVRIEEILVTATRSEESSLDVPAQVTVISREQLETSTASNVAEILDAQAGIASTDHGAEGALKTISIRGSTSSQVLVLVDGIRVNNDQNGVADLSLIPIENIQRIEIVRSGNSALYGADAVGGVVNIITRRATDNGLKLSVRNGSFIPEGRTSGKGSTEQTLPPQPLDLVDSQQVSIQANVHGRSLDLTSSASFTRAANAYTYTDLTGERRQRDNADLLAGDFAASLNWTLPTGYARFSGSSLYQDKGAPGPITAISLDTRQRDLQLRGSLSVVSDALFTDLLTLDLKGYYGYARNEYEDFGSSALSVHQLHTLGMDVSQEYFALDWLSLLYGANLSYEQARSTELASPQRLFAAGFLQASLYPWLELLIQPVLRYDFYTDFGGQVSGKLGAVLSVGAYSAVKASVSSAFRAPTFNDLYWPETATEAGNPDLVPETAYSAEIGFDIQRERFRQSLAVYGRLAEDVILWQPGSDGKWRPSNYGEGFYAGLDGQWEIRPWERLSLFLNYSFLLSYALSGGLTLEDDRRLPNLPAHSLDRGLTYRDARNTFTVQGHFQSLQYLKIDNVATLPGHFVVDVLYRHSFGRRHSLSLTIDNLFNAEYQVAPYYPMPGFALGVEMEFSL